jgi:hypothetical protein
MSPRVACRALAYGERGAGTDGARRQHPGALPKTSWRSGPSRSAGGCEFVSPSRGPPDRRCPRKRERPGSRPGLPTHTRLPARHKNRYGQCSRLADGSATGISLCARSLALTVIANPAVLRRWRWLSATSTSTRLAPRPGATTRARAVRGRRPSAAAGWTARGSCRCAAVTAASCPSTWRRGSMRWPATSPSGSSPERSCQSVSAASPPPP